MRWITFLFVFMSLSCLAQFNETHLDLLSKINTDLSDSWTPDIDYDDELNGILTAPVIMVDLMNHKTADASGNIGVSVYLFKKTDREPVESYNWAADKNSKVKFFETQTYIIVVDYFAHGGQLYNKLVDTLLIELDKYFKKNHSNL